MRRHKAARIMLDVLSAETPDNDASKTRDHLTIEAWLWRKLGEPGLAEICEGARDRT